jgi:hypothetical protein
MDLDRMQLVADPKLTHNTLHHHRKEYSCVKPAEFTNTQIDKPKPIDRKTTSPAPPKFANFANKSYNKNASLPPEKQREMDQVRRQYEALYFQAQN